MILFSYVLYLVMEPETLVKEGKPTYKHYKYNKSLTNLKSN